VPGFLGRSRLAHLDQCSLWSSAGSRSANSQTSRVSNTKNSTTESQPLHSSNSGPTIRMAEGLTEENNLSCEIGTASGVSSAASCPSLGTSFNWSVCTYQISEREGHSSAPCSAVPKSGRTSEDIGKLHCTVRTVYRTGTVYPSYTVR